MLTFQTEWNECRKALADADKRFAEGRTLCEKGEKLCEQEGRLDGEGDTFVVKGRRMYVEAAQMRNTAYSAFLKIVRATDALISWTHSEDGSITLSNGEVYK